MWGSPAFADEERWRRDAERAFDRSFHPIGTAASSSPSARPAPQRPKRLREVTTPTLVMHGDRDTLIDISGGRRTAELIPGRAVRG